MAYISLHAGYVIYKRIYLQPSTSYKRWFCYGIKIRTPKLQNIEIVVDMNFEDSCPMVSCSESSIHDILPVFWRIFFYLAQKKNGNHFGKTCAASLGGPKNNFWWKSWSLKKKSGHYVRVTAINSTTISGKQ